MYYITYTRLYTVDNRKSPFGGLIEPTVGLAPTSPLLYGLSVLVEGVTTEATQHLLIPRQAAVCHRCMSSTTVLIGLNCLVGGFVHDLGLEPRTKRL